MVALAGTAMPFAHSAEDEAERWLRALRLHGQVGAPLQALGVGESPLMTGSEAEVDGPGTPPMGPDVLDDVTRRQRGLRGRPRGRDRRHRRPPVRRPRRVRQALRPGALPARHEPRGAGRAAGRRRRGARPASDASHAARPPAAGPGTRCRPCSPPARAGETVAASSGHGKIPRRQPLATSRQSRIQPTPCVQPSTSFALSPRPPIATTSSAVKTHTSASE